MLIETPFRYLLVMVASGALVALLGWLGHNAPVRRNGWRSLEVSPMHWTGLVLGGGLVVLFLYVRLFVGSSRTDAAEQMNILAGLIVAFSIIVAICGWAAVQIRKQQFQWRGTKMAWREPMGESTERSMQDLAEVRRTPLGWIVLSFCEGPGVRFSESARGAGELIQSIAAARPDLSTPSAPPSV